MSPATHSRLAPAFLLAGSGLLLIGALAFQYFGGLHPCPLCVWQRYPHGAVIALSALALLLPNLGLRRGLSMLAIIAMLAGAVIAAFHAGVEQTLWDGLAACQGGTAFGDGSLSFDQMRESAESGPPPRCDEIPWSLFGVSLAGYNLIFSLGLAVAGVLLWRRPRRRPI